MPKYLIEAAKELLRVVVLAMVPLLISYLEQGVGIDYRAILIVGGIAGLRFIDKALHEYGKDNDSAAAVKGLTRF